jgi:fucose permease
MNSLRLILSNKRYFAPAYAFLCLNLVYGTWAIYIPQIKQHLGIDKAELGIAIFAMALGSFVSLTLAPTINDRIGCGKATAWGLLLLSIFGAGPFLAGSYATLCIALFLVGAAQGFLDVSMNATVSQIEKDDKVTLMAAMHGFFSLGGVVAGLGTFLIPIFDSALLHILLIILLIITVNLKLVQQYAGVCSTLNTEKSKGSNYLRPLLLLGVISFVVMGSEGAIVDWSGLYLSEVVGTAEFLVGAGFLSFSITMTLGRFFGDALSEKIGSEGVLFLGSVIAVLGYLGVLWGTTLSSILGFSAIGAGLSVMVPELFRMAGRATAISSNKAIALVAGFGYSGFLIGPVILGISAEAFGLVSSYYGLTAAIIIVSIVTISLLLRTKR